MKRALNLLVLAMFAMLVMAPLAMAQGDAGTAAPATTEKAAPEKAEKKAEKKSKKMSKHHKMSKKAEKKAEDTTAKPAEPEKK